MRLVFGFAELECLSRRAVARTQYGEVEPQEVVAFKSYGEGRLWSRQHDNRIGCIWQVHIRNTGGS